jgi:hypothetical protein
MVGLRIGTMSLILRLVSRSVLVDQHWNVIKAGRVYSAKLKWFCKDCRRYFSEYTWKDEYDRTIQDAAERPRNAESRQSNQSDILATPKREILPHDCRQSLIYRYL